MSTTTVILIAIAAVGLLLAVIYGVIAAAQLIQVKRLPPLPTPGKTAPSGASQDVPSRRFKGEAFEGSWQGSQGYERPAIPAAGENLADRLFVSTFTPLRPSRFGDSSYWNRYLPGVLIIYLGLFIGVPLVVAVIAQPTTCALSTFTPTQAERAVPGHGSYLSQPNACGHGSHRPGSGQSQRINYADDGTVFGVHPGGVVVVTYLYGKPLFSPGAPLCADPSGDADGVVSYVAAASGTGFIYIPQPNGTVVTRITVTSDLTGPQLLVVIIALGVVVVDVVLTVLLKRSARGRFSS
jgi:hypothetical protein